MISRLMAEFQKYLNDNDQALLTRTRQEHIEFIARIRAELNNSALDNNERVRKQSALEECESQLKTFDAAIQSLTDARDPKNRQQTNGQRGALQRESERLKSRLPIYARRDEIVNAVCTNQILILKADTGAGKSTQVVQYLVDVGLADQGKTITV